MDSSETGDESDYHDGETVTLNPWADPKATGTVKALLQRNPVLRMLLEWVDGFALVLDGENHVLAVSDALPARWLDRDPVKILGLRPGEALGCIYEPRGPEGCGTGPSCRFCRLLATVEASRAAEGPVDGDATFTTQGEGGVETYRYELQAVTVAGGDERFTVVLFRPAGERLRRLRRGVAGPGGDWPGDVDGYDYVRRLGAGGMGSVYLVRDAEGRSYAMKTARLHGEDDPVSLQRFNREREIALSLDHENVIRTYRAELSPSGIRYMVSEYCPGGSAHQQLQMRGRLPLDLALFWFIGAARGLEYLWKEHDIVHRDIKPENLLIDGEDRLKISDFGLARSDRVHSRLTLAGVIVGSPHYMSPEQLLDDADLDVRSDLYSLGATFYELLAGKPPFEAANNIGVLMKQTSDPHAPISERRPDLPSGLIHGLDGLLAKKRNDRPADPSVLLELLLDVARQTGIDPDSPPHPHPTSETTAAVPPGRP